MEALFDVGAKVINMPRMVSGQRTDGSNMVKVRMMYERSSIAWWRAYTVGQAGIV